MIFFPHYSAGQLIGLTRRILAIALIFVLSACGDKEPSGNSADESPSLPAGATGAEPLDQAGFFSKKLSSRPADGSGGALFEAITAEESGVAFANRVVDGHPLEHLYVSYTAGGLAIGDVNADGRPDLYFGNGPQSNGLFLQEAEGFRFHDATVEAGVTGGDGWGTGVAMVDVDNDGDLDIYACNYDSPNVLFLNDGTGKFSEVEGGAGIACADASKTPTFCDYDNDGDLDLYLVTNAFYRKGGIPEDYRWIDEDGKPKVRSSYRKFFGMRGVEADGRIEHQVYVTGQRNRLFRNELQDGKLVFTEQSDFAGDLCVKAGHGLAAVWSDFNGDGLPDVYASNDFETSDGLYINQGVSAETGRVTFKNVLPETLPHTPWYSMGSDLADLNNDGHFDLLTLDMAATTHEKQKRTMGDMGRFRWFIDKEFPPQLMRNALYLGTGTERFQEAAFLSGLARTDWSWAAKLADFDNDGRVDVFVTNGMVRSTTDSDMRSNLPDGDRMGNSEWDLYKDTPPLKEANLAYANRGDLKFDNVSRAWGLDHVGMSLGASYGDLDRDGDLDLIVVNIDEPVSIYRNNGSAGHSILVQLIGKENRFGIGAMVTVETEDGIQIRQMNPMTGYQSVNDTVLHFGLGDSEKIKKLSVEWPGGGVQEATDLEVDHHYFITEIPAGKSATPEPPEAKIFETVELADSTRYKERPFDDFELQPLLPNKLSELGAGIAVGDVDGDGLDDAFFTGAAGSSGRLFINTGKGLGEPVTTPFAADAPSEDMGALFFDFDADGDLDLYVVSGSYEHAEDDPLLQDRLYLNASNGIFSKAPLGTLPELRSSGSTVAAADFDRDGDLDLFIGGRVIPGRYPMAPPSTLLVNDSGKSFTLGAGFDSLGMVTGAVWSDLDSDGWVDLLVTSEWGAVKVLRNVEGKLENVTEGSGADDVLGWWNGISASDVDNDGDIDFAVSNFGLNTKYHASAEKPALLYYGKFSENDDRAHIIEAEFENDTLFPVRGRSCSSNAIPELRNKFETYKAFAVAPLEEIYDGPKLEKAQKFEANTLESGILINETEPGSGKIKLTFKPLPRIAQIAPAFGTAFTDYDLDGNVDLLMVQNFSSPQWETGRMAGGIGQLFRGSGDSEFVAVGADESGVVIPDDARALANIDLDGDGQSEFIATRNGRNAVVLKCSDSGKKGLTLQLVGPAGNPQAVGARVVLRSGEKQRALEIQSGHGYLSQGACRLAFALPSEWGDEFDLLIRWPDGTTSGEKLEAADAGKFVTIKHGEGRVQRQAAPTELPESERERIWEIEHRGNILNQKGFAQLSQAFASDVREDFAKALPENFQAWLPTKISGQISDPGKLKIGRMDNADLSLVDRGKFVEWIWERRPTIAGEPNLKLFLMNLSPVKSDDLEGRWFVRARLRIWGESADGGAPQESLVFMSCLVKGISDEHLEADGWLERCLVESSLEGNASDFLMGDVTEDSGFNVTQLHDNWIRGRAQHNTGGCFVTDFDRDGILDVVIGDVDLEKGIVIYRGLPDGKFKDVTSELGIREVKSGFVCLADFDNDGWVDLLHGWHDLIGDWRIYRNIDGKSFEDMSLNCGLAKALTADAMKIGPIGASLADYDGDGLIDIYISRASEGSAKKGSWIDGQAGPEAKNQLIRNLGGWKFENVTAATNSSAGMRSTFSSVWLDANDDNHPDIYVIHEFGNGALLMNDGAGKFEEVALVDEPSDFGSMGVTCGDVDGDGKIDIYVNGMYSKAGTRVMSNLPIGHYERHVTNSLRKLINGSELHRNLGGGKFQREGVARHIDAVGWGWGAALADFNGDGWLDLYATAGFMSKDRARPDG